MGSAALGTGRASRFGHAEALTSYAREYQTLGQSALQQAKAHGSQLQAADNRLSAAHGSTPAGASHLHRTIVQSALTVRASLLSWLITPGPVWPGLL